MSNFKYGFLFLLLPFASCFTSHKQPKETNSADDTNYHYTFNKSCNCFINKDNPNGINEVDIATYETDPDIHMMHGYYINIAHRKVDSFEILKNNPLIFRCQPCVTLEDTKKYIYYFEGKPTMEKVKIKISKNSKGMLHVD